VTFTTRFIAALLLLGGGVAALALALAALGAAAGRATVSLAAVLLLVIHVVPRAVELQWQYQVEAIGTGINPAT
jgi:hypothetical protein